METPLKVVSEYQNHMLVLQYLAANFLKTRLKMYEKCGNQCLKPHFESQPVGHL